MSKVFLNKIVVLFPYFILTAYWSLIIGCNSPDPVFPHEVALTSDTIPLQDINNPVKIEIKPPVIILQKMLSQTDAVFINDSLYVADAMNTASGLHPDMIDYYADPDMKRVYVNESHIVFCYGYKKQIDFMDFNYNLINRVKFKFANPTYIDPENQGDVKLSYVCSYLGRHYFYTLFWGISPNEYKPRSLRSSFLEVYDLEGNPVIRYHLKGKRPVYFAVDEETFTLYGPEVYDDPEEHLLVYKLQELCR